MSDEFGNWNELAKLWHKQSASLPVGDIERQVRLQRQQMVALAACEAAIMALSLIACVWIAMQTAFIALSGISFTFFGVCAFLQHRMQREPMPSGGDDLLGSLENSIARDEWNLAQLGIGRAVSFVTLFAIVMVASDHLRNLASTPAPRLWAFLGIASSCWVCSPAICCSRTAPACAKRGSKFRAALARRTRIQGQNPVSADTRFHALDAVRVVALLSGIALHSTMSFLPGFREAN